MDITAVVFRVDKEGIVFALFPELPSDIHGRHCTAYQHVGQHCGADYDACIANSRRATPEEYADLLLELEQRGYHLRIHSRAMPVMHERRRWAAAV